MASYNIEYGYAKGDELLRLVADTIKEEFPDALVCRGESDHFIVIDSYDECVGEKLLLIDNRIKRTAYGKTPGIQCAIVRLQPGQKAVEGVDRARTTMKEIGDDLNVVYREHSNSDDDEYYCYRAAVLKQRMHAYVETRALHCWTDQPIIPLASDPCGPSEA
jgi:GGDEF domain-containing protein